MKNTILVVSFGTTYVDALERSIGALLGDLRARFPDEDVLSAFTSRRVMEKLKRNGVEVESVQETVFRLNADPHSPVTVLPTFLIDGVEYDLLRETLSAYPELTARTTVLPPLLTDPSQRLALARFLTGFTCGSDAVLCMAHGTVHRANARYSEFSDDCRRARLTDLYTACLESPPTLDDVIVRMRSNGVRRVTLVPLLFTAGDHVRNDMTGESADSWVNILSREGFEVAPVPKGLGEYPEMRALLASQIHME